MNKKTLLIISYSPLNRDPRVLRQIDTLGDQFIITTAGLTRSEHTSESSFIPIFFSHNYTFHSDYPILIRKAITLLWIIPLKVFDRLRTIFLLRLFKSYTSFYWSGFRKNDLRRLAQHSFDAIIANDIEALPLAASVRQMKKSKLVFDAHEYAPLEYENDARWLRQKGPYMEFLCKNFVPEADYCSTVSFEIARKYKELTGSSFDVVLNATQYSELTPSTPESNKIRFVHHGVASPVRKIESMIEAFEKLAPSFELHLLLVLGDNDYFSSIKQRASKAGNIFFHEPVPTRQIPIFINQFDVSLIFIPPLNFNYVYCLPNKFFESIQARLMLVSGPSAEMMSFIQKHDLGKIAGGFEAKDIIVAIKGLSREEIMRYKNNVSKAALELSAESSMKLLADNIKRICSA